MNIFILDNDIELNVQYHCDAHIIKMILESVQMLSSCYRYYNGINTKVTLPDNTIKTINLIPDENYKIVKIKNKYVLKYENQLIYKSTHLNHPCSKWVRESYSNYHYLIQLTLELEKERKYRYKNGKLNHSSINLIDTLSNLKFEDKGLTKFALAMPEEYKTDDVVTSYRNYYKNCKQHLHSWKLRGQPYWI